MRLKNNCIYYTLIQTLDPYKIITTNTDNIKIKHANTIDKAKLQSLHAVSSRIPKIGYGK